jgi:hypothetical protein
MRPELILVLSNIDISQEVQLTHYSNMLSAICQKELRLKATKV